MNDEELEKKLSQMQLNLPEETGFQRAVYQRIQHVQESPPLFEAVWGLFDWIARPRVAVPAGFAVLAIAASLAVHNGSESRDQTWTNLAANYGERINPLSHVE